MSRKRKREPPERWECVSDHERFVRIFASMIDSPAFRALSQIAKRIYFILKNEYRGNYTKNNIKCPYSTMMSYGISRNSISPALRLLESLGFIERDSGALMRTETIFHFSDKWKEVKDIKTAKKIRADLQKQIKFEKESRKKLVDEYGDK